MLEMIARNVKVTSKFIPINNMHKNIERLGLDKRSAILSKYSAKKKSYKVFSPAD